MKYGRGRIVTLTLLSITMALALFCTGYVVNLTNFSTRAADTDVVANDSSSIPTFDDLYQRIPFKQTDTGSVKLGQNTTLTLIEERYDRTVLSSFLNANIRGSYSDLQKRRNNGYPYPVFTSSEMQKIANGGGNTLDIPVVMLDPQNYDDIVLFELTGLVDVPTELVITRDGIAPSIIAVDDQFSADEVYTGVPNDKLVGETQYVYDTEGNHVLSVRFEPNTDVSDGYVVEVKDTSDKYLYSINPSTSQPEEVKTISNGTTELYNSDGVWLYSVTRNGNQVTVEKADNTSSDTFIFNEIENQNVSYSIGAVAYNGNALRGMFKDPGFYEISFKQKISNGDGVLTQLDIAFDFVIVNKAQYINFPRFNTENRTTGSAEIYNYAYESEYPVVEYSSSRFDVQIHTSAEYDAGDEVNEQRELCFYNIGEYRMISSLQYYNSYLASREQSFINRGVNKGIVKLNRYTSYPSVLNIFGFQAYYGGQHANPKYNGPLPFFDSEYTEVGSDISALVREQGKTASAFGFESKNMNASESQSYTVQLAEYLTAQGIKPVRTNFPPVKIVGNVIH
ncbi:MAG: hypothetical protein IJ295_01085, partial [Clostridia bacterium]|nr:hypothetical protein [Clostridia bacterium]